MDWRRWCGGDGCCTPPPKKTVLTVKTTSLYSTDCEYSITAKCSLLIHSVGGCSDFLALPGWQQQAPETGGWEWRLSVRLLCLRQADCADVDAAIVVRRTSGSFHGRSVFVGKTDKQTDSASFEKVESLFLLYDTLLFWSLLFRSRTFITVSTVGLSVTVHWHNSHFRFDRSRGLQQATIDIGKEDTL